MSIDLKRTEGRAAFMRLVAQADILLEGFRPGVPEGSASALTTALPANRVARRRTYRAVKKGKTGAPDTIRTCDLCLRRATATLS